MYLYIYYSKMNQNDNQQDNKYKNKIEIDSNTQLTIVNNKDDINEKDETIILYSNYGYIRISLTELNDKNIVLYKFTQYRQSPYTNKSSIIGMIHKNNVKNYINIKIKTLSGNRKIYNIKNLCIYSSLNTLIEKIVEQEKKEIKSWEKGEKNEEGNELINKVKLSQFRLYSSRYGVRELNTSQNIYENDIQEDELLVYLPEIIINFSSSMKGKSIDLSPDHKTALKMDTDDPQYILGNIGYNNGRHYFEVTLLTDPFMKSIIIGFCTKKDEESQILDIKNFYGYILSEGKRMTNVSKDEDLLNYGEKCGFNDVIGVLIEFNYNGVYITFYRNKKSLGKAFCMLPKNQFYYPAVRLGLCGSKVKITNEIDFPE